MAACSLCGAMDCAGTSGYPHRENPDLPMLQSLSHLSDPSLSLSFPQPEGRTGGRVYFKPGPRVPFVTMEISALRKETAVRSHPPHRAAQPSRMELMALPTSPSSWWQWTCGLSLPPSFSRCLHQLPPPVQVQRIPPGSGVLPCAWGAARCPWG